jgi:hypothetical protein
MMMVDAVHVRLGQAAAARVGRQPTPDLEAAILDEGAGFPGLQKPYSSSEPARAA